MHNQYRHVPPYIFVPGSHRFSKSHAVFFFFCGFGIFVLAPSETRLHTRWKPRGTVFFRFRFLRMVSIFGQFAIICGVTGTSALTSAVLHIPAFDPQGFTSTAQLGHYVHGKKLINAVRSHSKWLNLSPWPPWRHIQYWYNVRRYLELGTQQQQNDENMIRRKYTSWCAQNAQNAVVL